MVHTVSRDHGELEQVRGQFARFAGQCRQLLVNGGCAEALALASGHPDALCYGVRAAPHAPLEIIAQGPHRARGLLRLGGEELLLDLPQPGVHNLENAACADLVAYRLGVAVRLIRQALETFPGVSRRFVLFGTSASGFRVIDDYAHNGEKIAAAVRAAQAGCDRLLAVFQPHGYGPARFLRPELRQLLPGLLREQDRFCYLEIYYAGGSVSRDLSSRDLASDLPAALRCGYAGSHAELLGWLAGEVQPQDTVLLLGARDPDLPTLARSILAAL